MHIRMCVCVDLDTLHIATQTNCLKSIYQRISESSVLTRHHSLLPLVMNEGRVVWSGSLGRELMGCGQMRRMVFNTYGPDRLKYNHGLHCPLDTAHHLLRITGAQQQA